jgi:hypothetical protein
MNCISANIKLLKRRSVSYNQLPKEFGIVELRKQIQDNLNTFNTYNEIKRNVFSPNSANINITGISELPPIIQVVERKTTMPVVEPTPPPVVPTPEPVVEPPMVSPPPSSGGGSSAGSSGGGYLGRDYGTGFGMDQVFTYDMSQRENIK